MAALDILLTLEDLKVESLDPLQRVMLITDGTLTDILEAAFFEPIQLIKIQQETQASSPLHACLHLEKDEQILERKVLLRGSKTARNYVYAHSIIAFERLTPTLVEALLDKNIPLGRLWLQHKLETFKELQEIHCRAEKDLAPYFDGADATRLLSRTYCVSNNNRPVMRISEFFPIRFTV